MRCCRRSQHHCHRDHGNFCRCHTEREHHAECECGCGVEEEHDTCCGGGGHHRFRRSYRSKAEVIAELESYLAELKAETQAVEERLGELRG